MLPIESLILDNRELGLLVAVLIGFGFGFVLERAGFGNAKKLAGQFYLNDMTVFKVMFSAIVTAMLGVVIAAGVGVIDLTVLSEQAVSFTYLWPMLAGGLLLGAGFIISGYCPGTSVVATASGNLDGLFTFSGVVIGSVVYGELFPVVSGFHSSGEKGFFFLYSWLGVPPALLAAGVALAAIAMFLGAEKVEKIFSEKQGKQFPIEGQSQRGRIYALGAMAGLAALTGMSFALPEAGAERTERETLSIEQPQLAKRIVDEPWTMRILDIRDKKACAAKRIPGAECTPEETVKDLGLAYASSEKDLILVADQTADLPPGAEAYPGRVYALKDGFAGWKRYALVKPVSPDSAASEEERSRYRFQTALHSAMTGRKPAPPPAPTGSFVPKKKKKGGGCS